MTFSCNAMRSPGLAGLYGPNGSRHASVKVGVLGSGMHGPAALLGCVVLLGACGDNLRGSPADDASTIDSVTDADGACGQWAVSPAPASNLRLFDPAPIGATRTLRVAFDVVLSACDELGAVRIVNAPLATQITITPFRVRQIAGTCQGTPRTVMRVAEVHVATAGTKTITLDATPAQTLTVTVGAGPNPACRTQRTTCLADCDCDEAVGERCLGVMQGTTPTTMCARPCELDRDCGGTRCADPNVPGALPFTCTSAPECDATRPCSAGFACMSGACTPSFTLNPTTRHACACDAECAAGMRCVDAAGDEPATCEAVCHSNGAWCDQGPHTCLGAVDADFSVCGWIGE